MKFGQKHIGAIYPQIPAFFECSDGTFSTAQGSRACARHGGRRSDIPVELGGGGLLNVRDIRLSEIQVKKNLFQGREKDFSERSVNNIVSDATSNKFLWQNLDPITLWQDGKGHLFLVSGHSRFEAFKRLAAMGVQVDGKGFDRIPAKTLKNVSQETAQTVALESNTLSSKETDVERAAYYRRLRQDGTRNSDLLATMKKNEGRNWTNIQAFSFLNPSGKTWQVLIAFAENEDQSSNLAKTFARWIGNARRQFPALTNEHETELHNWIFEEKGYGSGGGQVATEADFLEKVNLFIQKNTFFGAFDAAKPLNIKNLLYKSPVEIEYDQQIAEASQLVKQFEATYKKRVAELTAAKTSQADFRRIMQPIEANLSAARQNLQRLLLKKSQVVEYSKNEATLFGIGRAVQIYNLRPIFPKGWKALKGGFQYRLV